MLRDNKHSKHFRVLPNINKTSTSNVC